MAQLHYTADAALKRGARLAKMLRKVSRPSKQRFIDWTAIEAQKKRIEDARWDRLRRAGQANREVEEVARENAALPVTGRERDADLQVLAERRAGLMSDDLADLYREFCSAEDGTRGSRVRADVGADARVVPVGHVDGRSSASFAGRTRVQPTRAGGVSLDSLDRLNEALRHLDARPFRFIGKRPRAEQLRSMLERARCPVWWLRQLKRTLAQRFEAEAIFAGRVGPHTGQTYCTDEALRRRTKRRAAAAAMLEATWIESEDGDEVNLKACADASVSNRAIRRGELMTRIRGCEEWADERGMVGLFVTCTTPSRFHYGVWKRNEKFERLTPKDSQAWLCATWARARAEFVRAGVQPFGFRVAEPHEDGCTHWHMLLWVQGEDEANRLEFVMRSYWLADAGNEPGAQKVRITFKRMAQGGATGYIAKYVAKNIDDAGSVGDQGHTEVGGNAARVDAWASVWGIHQFQAIGQPPVGVWRELRRIDREHAPTAPMRVSFAMDGAHRVDDERASWHVFLKAQGGVCTGRNYLIRLARFREVRQGRYEALEVARPIGVYEAGNPSEVVPSTRKEWRPRGAWGQGERARIASHRAPWTRFNNCTQPLPKHHALPVLMSLGIVAARSTVPDRGPPNAPPGFTRDETGALQLPPQDFPLMRTLSYEGPLWT